MSPNSKSRCARRKGTGSPRPNRCWSELRETFASSSPASTSTLTIAGFGAQQVVNTRHYLRSSDAARCPRRPAQSELIVRHERVVRSLAKGHLDVGAAGCRHQRRRYAESAVQYVLGGPDLVKLDEFPRESCSTTMRNDPNLVDPDRTSAAG